MGLANRDYRSMREGFGEAIQSKHCMPQKREEIWKALRSFKDFVGLVKVNRDKTCPFGTNPESFMSRT